MSRSAVVCGDRHGARGIAAGMIRHHAATGLLAGHLGLGGWLRLAPALAEHWAAVDRAAQVCQGQVSARASGVGRIVAAAARLLGCPFGPVDGDAIPVSVRVWLGTDRQQLHWRRTYAIPGRPPLVVRSTMATLPDGRLAEVFPGGLGVTLRLDERDGGLAFTSTGFVWRVPGRCLGIPHWLGPGRLTVIEGCDAAGSHRLALTVVHPWLGEIYRLDGAYRVIADGLPPCGPAIAAGADPASAAVVCPDVSVYSEGSDR